jgi:hypothetical protein
MVTLNEFLKSNLPNSDFSPRPLYTAEGDCLTFYFVNEDSYRERVDDLLTIYRSMKNQNIIGCQVKGVRRILQTLGKFSVGVKEGPVELGLVFLTYKAESDNPRSQGALRENGSRSSQTPGGASL